MPTVTIVDRNRVVEVPAGCSILEALEMAGVNIMHACGGNCICGTCNVEVLAGRAHLAPPAEAERLILKKLKRQGPGVRLTCQAHPTGDVTIKIGL
ncbi:MAG TPA: 2Fe-2S iron-sulfur cluster-binding protein [Planctomycetota bacterium]|nr:2Fe-2S iron-sulfur cluster-binding protein [Planctomycetota bacterium]